MGIEFCCQGRLLELAIMMKSVQSVKERRAASLMMEHECVLPSSAREVWTSEAKVVGKPLLFPMLSDCS